MVINERMREIGTIRAIGMTRTKVILMFLYESIWLGIFAIIIGIALAQLVAFIINTSGGIYIPPPPTHSDLIMKHAYRIITILDGKIESDQLKEH